MADARDYVLENEDFQCLNVYTELQELVIRGQCSIDAAKATAIGCPKLKRLVLHGSTVALKDVQAFPELRDVELVMLIGDSIRNESLDGIESMPNLSTLIILRAKRLDETSLARLADCKLTTLRLGNCSLDGTELAFAEMMPRLEQLSLYNNPITDAAEPYLAACTGLKQLDLRKTYVTTDLVGRLRAALPECDIQYEEE
jgi:hypothetical protein